MKKIQILGTGCPTCCKMYDAVRELVAQQGEEARGVVVEKITDVQQMMQMGVMSVPALVVDGKVLFSGRGATRDELKGLLGIA